MQLVELASKKSSAHTLRDIRDLVDSDMDAMHQLIQKELVSDVPMIKTINQHIIDSGGKRLRPMLVILTAKALGYKGGNEHYELAAIIEFIHTATLLHDDVVDHSSLRRGQETASAIWGNSAAVLTGDFLYSRAFQILARRTNIPVMKALADTTNQIAEGEVLQLMNCNNPDITEVQYRNVIHRKTAVLYRAATYIGARISTEDKTIHQALANYGEHLGMAFQMIDDLLDYTADIDQTGKNLGDDLAEGKTTLPLIHAMHHGSESERILIQTAIQNGKIESLAPIIKAIETTQAPQYIRRIAQQEIKQAQAQLSLLPKNPYQQALHDLSTFVIQRDF